MINEGYDKSNSGDGMNNCSITDHNCSDNFEVSYY